MKSLANCTPTEFLKQAMRIRAPFKEWLNHTGIPEIRKHVAEVDNDIPEEEKVKLAIQQGQKNFSEMMSAALEKDFDATIDLICLFTFTERADFDSNPFPEYLAAILDCLRSEAVRDFFMLYL